MNRKPSLSKELQAAEYFVRLAMAQAELAARSGNAPFGAVIVDTLGDVAAAEHNRIRETLDPSARAEINAIRVACGRARRATLEGYRLYVNKEPCPMCLVCTVEARLSAVYYGDPDDGSASDARCEASWRSNFLGARKAEARPRRLLRYSARASHSIAQDPWLRSRHKRRAQISQKASSM